MSKIKELSQEDLEKVNGGVVLSEGQTGYYARYVYCCASDVFSNIKEGILGPFDSKDDADRDVHKNYAKIRIVEASQSALFLFFYYKDENGTVTSQGWERII